MTTPVEFQCPITFEIMVDPVMGDDGHTYERAAITESLARDPRSPMTRSSMSISSLRPNYALKSQIERFLTATATATTTTQPTKFVSHPVSLSATIHDGALNITLTPPVRGERQPIVMLLALDNSGSMDEEATASDEAGVFTRMDLCKHTIRTVAAMLKDDDILGLVSFSTTARIVLKPTAMTSEGKARLESALKTVIPDAQTNIWAGLETIHRLATKFSESHVVAALLTDGLPNINPPRGIVQTYKTLVKPYTMSTFGFGYSLDSDILCGIATEGRGSFGFIPDYSMVATVFINWAATALATACSSIPIRIENTDGTVTTFQSGSIQMGQPRTFICTNARTVERVVIPTASVVPNNNAEDEFLTCRNDIQEAIRVCLHSSGTTNTFRTIYETYRSTTNPKIQALLRDIQPDGDEGQVIMAPRYFERWGKHYLRAYHKAQELEQCMNFKDPGLQIYGGDLFHEVQAEGEAAFSTLPALEATGRRVREAVGAVGTVATVAAPLNTQMFYNSSGGCFHGDSRVRMADDSRLPISSLRRGDRVWTPTGPSTVLALVVCTTAQPTQSMCQIGDLLITPWHPIQRNATTWCFPCDVAPILHSAVHTVYNVLLDRGHILDFNEVLCVTLAHNFKGPVVEHEFFGTSNVIRDLEKAAGWDVGTPTFQNLCARRDPISGRICGWYEGV